MPMYRLPALAALLAAFGLAGPALALELQAAERALFAGGCFWCMEADFEAVPGVISVTSGYTGGAEPAPRYEDVARGRTGHAEAIEVLFDPGEVSYEQLLARFWHSVDPTTANRQFCDRGRAYRSEIFTLNLDQQRAAEASKAELERTKPFDAPIVTPVTPAGPFYPAEAEHQDFYKRNPLRYRYYRFGCGRDRRLRQLWGE